MATVMRFVTGVIVNEAEDDIQSKAALFDYVMGAGWAVEICKAFVGDSRGIIS